MNQHIDAIRKQIADRAADFCNDNVSKGITFGHYLVIETAMLIGASIALGTPVDLDDDVKLTDTPEGEEMLRQLFEGDKDPGRCPCGEDH